MLMDAAALKKRTALFDFVGLKIASVVFLQETLKYSCKAQWLNEWKGQAFFSHGSNVSAGVAVHISSDLQIQDNKVT